GCVGRWSDGARSAGAEARQASWITKEAGLFAEELPTRRLLLRCGTTAQGMLKGSLDERLYASRRLCAQATSEQAGLSQDARAVGQRQGLPRADPLRAVIAFGDIGGGREVQDFHLLLLCVPEVKAAARRSTSWVV